MALFHIIIVCLAASASSVPISNEASSKYSYPFTFVSREEWGARPPGAVTPLATPVPFVVVHHSSIPTACYTKEACMQNMRSMQNTHQYSNGWQDIGYNFAVGGDGAAYEGRGWDAVGAHAVGYNVKSIGIVLIGDFVLTVPPAGQIQTLKDLIAVGVGLGYISKDYQLIGHRQVSATECPGEAFFNVLSTWDRFVPTL